MLKLPQFVAFGHLGQDIQELRHPDKKTAHIVDHHNVARRRIFLSRRREYEAEPSHCRTRGFFLVLVVYEMLFRTSRTVEPPSRASEARNIIDTPRDVQHVCDAEVRN